MKKMLIGLFVLSIVALFAMLPSGMFLSALDSGSTVTGNLAEQASQVSLAASVYKFSKLALIVFGSAFLALLAWSVLSSGNSKKRI